MIPQKTLFRNVSAAHMGVIGPPGGASGKGGVWRRSGECGICVSIFSTLHCVRRPEHALQAVLGVTVLGLPPTARLATWWPLGRLFLLGLTSNNNYEKQNVPFLVLNLSWWQLLLELTGCG